ncbi:plasma membrane protein Pth11-like protein [Hypoxylon trugodes]|uniref:plasma membrane protein Pth11-like protein n=1 Tax=Hypoxylon trugodes TaxID=326681 RepID=UPI00218DFD74|nr:plasma membrane protein Pth11-like protein [Hypoxylon trugodes]KAI1387194.1 plasma membrane protein Pth11-like protein [Hypoxylon trugodes]
MDSYQTYMHQPGPIIAAAAVLPLVGLIAVILKFWVRKKQKQPLKADDWLMIPAILLTCGSGICVVYGVSQKVVAYPIGTSPPHSDGKHSTLCLIQWVFGLIFPLTLGCIKTSFLFFYMRIFSVTRRSTVNYVLVGMIILVVSLSTAFFLADLIQCVTNWSMMEGPSADILIYCTHMMKTAFAISICDFITDAMIIVIPIPLVWRLNLTTSKKFAASAVFLLGAVSTIASVIRLGMMSIMMFRIGQPEFDPMNEGSLLTEYLYWGLIELGIGVCAACLPTLQFLVRKRSPKSIFRAAGGHFKPKRVHSIYEETEASSLEPLSPIYTTRDRLYRDIEEAVPGSYI